MQPFSEFDVFISYSHADIDFARAVRDMLSERELRVWWDERLTSTPSVDFVHQIVSALNASARVVVLWSTTSARSEWVCGEAEKARAMHKVVPIALEPLGSTDGPSALYQLLSPSFVNLPTQDWEKLQSDPAPLFDSLGAIQVQGKLPGVLAIVDPQVDVSRLPVTYAKKLYGRDREMRALVKAWDAGATRIVVFDAMGGAGKTALIYHFVQTLKASGWRGARRVFAWSFYSQGSSEDRQVGSDDFFRSAFKFFSNDTLIPPRELHERGTELAKLIRANRSLLILDGLEPLQYTTKRSHSLAKRDESAGGLKDQAIRALLASLAGQSSGLCLVTTRIPVVELHGDPAVEFESLGRLPLMDAIALLRDLGVANTHSPATHKMPARESLLELVPPYSAPASYMPTDAATLKVVPEPVARDLISIVEELWGHALALSLVGNWLVEHHQGNTRSFAELPDLPSLAPDAPERAPYRVIQGIEIALLRRVDEEGASAIPAKSQAGLQLALLIFLGLFDRPVRLALLPVAFPKGPSIKLKPFEGREDATTHEQRGKPRQTSDQSEAARHRLLDGRRRDLVCGLLVNLPSHNEARDSWRGALVALARSGLISQVDDTASWEKAEIDCHPLVRSYFALRMREIDERVAQGAHSALYDHYRYLRLAPAFNDPIVYGLLALKAAYEKDHYPRLRSGLLDGTLSASLRDSIPPSIARLELEQLKEPFDLVDGPDWPAVRSIFLPDNEDDMTPLLAAVHHGCAAGRHQEAFAEVYRPRIQRGNDYFASTKLGMFGSELAALANFFDEPFDVPSDLLTLDRRALALASAGLLLRAVGRPRDAIEAWSAEVRIRLEQQNWSNAAVTTGNLNELLLNTGRIFGDDGAVKIGVLAVEYGDRTASAFRHVTDRCKYAPTLLAAGRLAEAESMFRHAEELEKTCEPDRPLLYATDSYQYCDLLLARGRAAEVEKRAAYALSLAEADKLILHIGLGKVNQAAAALMKPLTPALACDITADALAALRRANSEHHLPRGLLLHAEALWRSGQSAQAEKTLQEAQAVSRRTLMPLFEASVALLEMRLLLLAGDNLGAATQRDTAANLIGAVGWRRGEVELALLDAELATAAGHPDRKAQMNNAILQISGRAFLDKRLDKEIDGGWWGLLPRLLEIVPLDSPDYTDLQDAHARFDTERNAYLLSEGAVDLTQ